MDIDLDELKRLALAAAPGPWWGEMYSNGTRCVGGNERLISDGEAIYSTIVDGGLTEENQRFIVAANPAVILELIAEIELLQAQNEANRNDANRFCLRVAALEAENAQLKSGWEAQRELRDAVWNLMQMKGRHNTEIAYQRLEAIYLKAVKESPILARATSSAAVE